MLILRLWNNISIRKKIWGLVLLPTIVILGLSGRQVLEVNDQLTSLKKATHVINVIGQLKNLNTASYESRSSANNKSKIALENLTTGTNVIFSEKDINQYQQLIKQYKETINAVTNAEDPINKQYSIQWQTDLYKQLLLTIEKTQFKAPIPVIDSNLSALLQLEWLIFWVQEENWQSKILINTQNIELSKLLKNEIRALIQNQQLFIDRFVVINADETQVELLLSAFSDPAFEQSNTFREQLLNKNTLSKLTQLEFEQGMQAFAQRLLLFKNVTAAIEKQLQQDIQQAVTTFEKQRIIFFSITAISILCVLLFGIALAHRITLNLNTVIDFLDHKDDPNKELKLYIEGNDELSQFAEKVERLTIERQKNQRELLTSKNEAIAAKEEAITASKAKSSFLANMSHEIRTPLNGVIGISDILSSTHLSATQKDYVDTIETSSQLLLSLINDILDFSKIESGKLPISTYSTCLRESVYDVSAIVAPTLKEKSIELNINIDPNLPIKVLADDHRIRQVLMNLMSNAAKFTETGSISIGIQYQKNKQGISSFLFEVIDTGIGINEAQQKKIFDPFSQEDNSTTRKFGGTGLGLAISTQLIELMGGELQLDSQKEKGSRFYFYLPLEVTELESKNNEKFNQTTVTIVCNNTEITQTLEHELEALGIKSVEIKQSLLNLTKPTNTHSQIIIYAINQEMFDHIETIDLTSFNEGNRALCLVQPLHAPQINLGSSITSLITYPLLGNKLLKGLEHCYEFIQSNTQNIIKNITSAPSTKKILVVEDNKINQKVVILHLTTLGYEYDIANNGQEAVNLFTTNHYDLILMDCMMPIKDGFIATKEIRQYEKLHKSTYTTIIALTASVVEEDIQQCFTCGMNDYLPKPFKAEILKSKILNAMNDSTQKQEESTEKAIQENQKEQNNTPAISSVRILLVEDNKINQKVAALFFQKAGYQYVVANDGQEAIDIYSNDQSFDIILMDLMMPRKDGFEASIDIRAYEKSNDIAETPIIAVTASVVNDDIEQCFKVGMNAYIPKPIQPDKLYSEIENCLKTKA
ncbi:response regulator [Pseudocolwellia agarivorans]|uniref:response regulator n=1 Tax=Pseudocolwellia agarivorans TaxID=1911682 RepID=UPI0009847DC1|nr:response regulator [Pseudocolwellia agarivorans]